MPATGLEMYKESNQCLTRYYVFNVFYVHQDPNNISELVQITRLYASMRLVPLDEYEEE